MSSCVMLTFLTFMRRLAARSESNTYFRDLEKGKMQRFLLPLGSRGDLNVHFNGNMSLSKQDKSENLMCLYNS